MKDENISVDSGLSTEFREFLEFLFMHVGTLVGGCAHVTWRMEVKEHRWRGGNLSKFGSKFFIFLICRDYVGDYVGTLVVTFRDYVRDYVVGWGKVFKVLKVFKDFKDVLVGGKGRIFEALFARWDSG